MFWITSEERDNIVSNCYIFHSNRYFAFSSHYYHSTNSTRKKERNILNKCEVTEIRRKLKELRQNKRLNK